MPTFTSEKDRKKWEETHKPAVLPVPEEQKRLQAARDRVVEAAKEWAAWEKADFSVPATYIDKKRLIAAVDALLELEK